MRFFLLICFSLPCGFAQTNPMGYFYMGRYEEAIPDFAALAVLESQNCPSHIIYGGRSCTSRYRIIRILDAKSDAVKKEYIEAKEESLSPYFRHRPMLIFGRYKDGHLQIEGYEEIRDYYSDSGCDGENCIGRQDLRPMPFVPFLGYIYVLHSIGTPYYNIKNLDSVDMLYYNEYLASELKPGVDAAGKDFGKLLLRLTQNRTPIKAAKIKNDFAALGKIKNMRPAGDSKRTNLYELGVAVETVIKNDAKIEPSTAIFIDRDRLPLGWGCQPFDYYLKTAVPFYFFGNLRDGRLVIDSLVSPLDAFVFADTIYDISMGLPFEELISYFLSSNTSLEEFKFGQFWRHNKDLGFAKIRDSKRAGKIHEKIADMPECLRNDLIEIAIKTEDYWDNIKRRPIEKSKINFSFGIPAIVDELFRCRTNSVGHVIDYDKIPEEIRMHPREYEANERKLERRICRGYSSGEGVWGRKW